MRTIFIYKYQITKNIKAYKKHTLPKQEKLRHLYENTKKVTHIFQNSIK